MTARFRRRLGSVGLARGGSLLGVAVLATGLAARVVRTRFWPAPKEVAGPAPAGGRSRRAGGGPQRATRRTVTPKAGGGWTVGGGSRSKEYRTQAEAEHAARSELLAKGGGELVVKGKDGKVRDQTTVGKADAQKTAGKDADPHKSTNPNKATESGKGGEPHPSTEPNKTPDAHGEKG